MKKKKSLALTGTLLAAVTAGSLIGTQFPAITVMADDTISSTGNHIIMASSNDDTDTVSEDNSDLVYEPKADMTEKETTDTEQDAEETAVKSEKKTKDESESNKTTTDGEEKNTEETASEKNTSSDAVSIEDKFQDEGQATVQIDENVAKVVVLPEVKKDGYKFLYWNTKEDGSGTTYYAGDQFTIGSEKDLYAIWEEADTTTFHIEPDTENTIPESKNTDQAAKG